MYLKGGHLAVELGPDVLDGGVDVCYRDEGDEEDSGGDARGQPRGCLRLHDGEEWVMDLTPRGALIYPRERPGGYQLSG